ncbi:type II toxin-antitoxin system RelE/ParE family toxin [Phyllobacterium sp. 628]|uniref:type II toxin-antitoxin system RelE/ParE family toxin n=1 Tax=Phyllobacterium sp. 628 TaxID=2718938 RepID=UPI001662870D|nr:type II toxin-antitoxin system RelE/ParE family toxin [Phyllobacterium sp. 628]QND53797.1 type II toxin-antitoxin system RelE/ParE family toxin [Phyllobacterium sp. 628]
MKIVRTKRYLKDLKRLGVSDADVNKLEHSIAVDPFAGDVIQGLEGLRKIRFSIGNKGKSGGGRAIYYLMISDDLAIMIFAYRKSEQADLTPDQRKAALIMLRELKND